MATMATATTVKQWYYMLPALLVISGGSFAGDWQFTPKLSSSETYSDNVELTQNEQISSYVNQTSVGLDTNFSSRMASLSFSGTNTYASYTHDHDLDDSFRSLSAKGKLFLWTGGPALVAQASIRNVSSNSASNSLADLVSGDTVETQSYSTGIEYNTESSYHTLSSSLTYSTNRADDNIGENDNYSAIFNSQSGNANRNIFWRVNGQYNDRKNRGNTGRNHIVEAIFGWINPIKVNPFIRIYNEDFSGNITLPRSASGDSIGVGINWQVSQHIELNSSYNYVTDDSNDDYIAALIRWLPSARTSLFAKYSRRFFGDAYEFRFTHKTRRLTNNINYTESLRAFDRSTIRQVLVGRFFCPSNISMDSISPSQCFPSLDDVVNIDNLILVEFVNPELIEGNEFSLNKTLSWQSQLNLARTSFTFSLSNSERESLTTNVKDNRFSASINASRQISGKSNVALRFNYRHSELDKDKRLSMGQEDYYRIYSLIYNRSLAASLKADFTIQQVDRSSSANNRTYDELRAIISLTKEF